MIQIRPSVENVQPRLEALLEAPHLPARAVAAGRQLLQRLISPIRVVVLGQPGTGKSALVNLIAGDRLLPDNARLPTVEICLGPEPRVSLVDRDGGEMPITPGALARVGRDAAALVRIEAPLPILSTLTLIEVAAHGTAEDERASILWAAERADVVIWCSQEFTAAEQWLWSAMPENLKDHAFLVLTKADLLIRSGEFATRLAELQEIAAEEFHSLVPVATLQGLDALHAPGGTDRAALTSSGADGLVTALLRHVEQGRRADLDAALLFIARFGVEAVPEAAEPPPAARPVLAAVPSPADVPPPADAAPAPDRPRTAPRPQIPRPVSVPAPPEDVVQAAELLQRCGASLASRATGGAAAEEILEGCAQAAQAVADLLETAPDRLGSLRDEAMDVADKLILLGLERSEGAAADAVTLLLQFRRDLLGAEAA